MMDILSSFGVDIRLLVIQMVNFAIVFVVLWKFLYIPLIEVIKKRQNEIEKGLKDAQKAKEELETIHKKEEEIISEARKKAQDIADNAKKSAELQAQEIVSDAKDKAESILDEASKIAKAEKDKALKQAKQDIAKAAILAASRILQKDKS